MPRVHWQDITRDTNVMPRVHYQDITRDTNVISKLHCFDHCSGPQRMEGNATYWMAQSGDELQFTGNNISEDSGTK